VVVEKLLAAGADKKASDKVRPLPSEEGTFQTVSRTFTGKTMPGFDLNCLI